MKTPAFDKQVRRLALTWLALIALMLASLGSAYLPLGIGNTVTGLVVAVVKSALVVLVFMRLGSASVVVRLAAAAALATLLLLVGLSGVDYATRADEPAPFQQPPSTR